MKEEHTVTAHSWFISVVDCNELCPVYQVNQSKNESHENEGARGRHDFFFEHKYPLTMIFFLEFHACSLLGLCVPGVTEGPETHTLRTT